MKTKGFFKTTVRCKNFLTGKQSKVLNLMEKTKILPNISAPFRVTRIPYANLDERENIIHETEAKLTALEQSQPTFSTSSTSANMDLRFDVGRLYKLKQKSIKHSIIKPSPMLKPLPLHTQSYTHRNCLCVKNFKKCKSMTKSLPVPFW